MPEVLNVVVTLTRCQRMVPVPVPVLRSGIFANLRIAKLCIFVETDAESGGVMIRSEAKVSLSATDIHLVVV